MILVISNFMEQKKQLLIKVLKKLQPQRDMAEGFLALLESEYLTDEIVNKLIGALQDAMDQVSKENEKEKLNKGLKLMKKIKNQEDQEDKKMTDEDLDKLLENL